MSKLNRTVPFFPCGVRGTTFFIYFENGVSGSLFTAGNGYMYSKGQPSIVKQVAPGVLMIVTGANKPPEAKPAKPGDATKLYNATNPSEKKDDKKGEDKKEGGTGGGTSGSGGGTTAASGGTTDTTMLGGDPTATLGTAPPGTLASQIETGTTADTPGTSSPLTNPTQGPQVVVPVTPNETTFPSVIMETGTVSPTKSETATFMLSSTSTATPVTFEYKFNNVDWQAITGNTLTLTAPNLPEGNNSIIFRAKDSMGNLTPEDSYAQKQWTVYYTNPDVSWVKTPPPEATSLNSSFSVEANRPAGHVNYSYTLDGENWINAEPLFAVTNGLKKDENNISLKATDIAGNSSTIDYSWYLTGLDLLQQFTLGGLSGTLATTPITLTEGEGTGTIELTASGTAGVSSTPISGSLTDGTVFNGYLAGIPGSWRGLFTTLYKKDSTIGIMSSNDLTDAVYNGGTLNAMGTLLRTEAGTTNDTATQLFSNLPLLVLQNLAIGQVFDDPVIRGPYRGEAIRTDGIVGYATQSGGILGTWGTETTAGAYVNATGDASEIVPLYHYSYFPEYADPTDHFAFGSVTVTDDLAGHTTVSGTDSLTYLDRQYLGKLSLDYRGVYDFSPEASPTTGVGYSYSSVGTGIYNLQALSWSGDWGQNQEWRYYGPSSLYKNTYYPEDGYSSMELVAHETGLVGGVKPFWEEETSRLTALGYIVDDGGAAVAGEMVAGPFLWNSGIAAQATTGIAGEEEFLPDAEFTGVTAGVWKDGLMNGSAYAIYKTAAGQAGWLIGAIGGTYNSDLGVWKAEGDLVSTQRIAQLPAGITSADLEVFHDIAMGIAGGSFTGDQGIINNYSSIMQTTFYGKLISVYDEEYQEYVDKIIPMRWGIYDLQMASGNSFSGKPAGDTSWTSKIGGYGPTQMQAPFFYLADISGNWLGNGTINGQLSGTYMTPLYLGVLSGPFYGLYPEGDMSGSGGWIGQSVGTYNVTQKLAHSATWGENLYVWYSGEGGLFTDAGGWLDHTGYVMGLLGGTTAPWSGSSALKAMGLFQVYVENNSGRGTYLWSGAIQGSVPQEIAETASAGGIYTGYSAALWRTDSYAGAIRTLYLTPPDATTGKSTAGFLAGDNMAGSIYNLTQDTYEDVEYTETYTIGAWESTGTNNLTASAPLASGLDPEAVTLAGGSMNAKLYGTFGGAGALTNDTAWGDFTFFMNGATPLPFGVYDLKLGSGDPGGTFSGKPDGATSWDAKLGGGLNIGGGPALAVYGGYNYEYGYWLADVGGQWNAAGEITGNVTNGKYLTTIQSGTLSGPFYGLYTEMGTDETGVYGTWVGQSIGNYQGLPLQYASSTIYTPLTSTNRVYSGEYTYPEAYSGYNYSYNSDNTGSMYYYRNQEGGDYYTITYYADGTYSKYDYNSSQTTTGTWQDAEHSTLAFLQEPPDKANASGSGQNNVAVFENGSISSALLGGTDSIWSATSTSPAQATMMGQYVPGTSVPSLWNTTAYSYNYKKDTFTTYDSGAYTGWLVGTLAGNTGDANFLGLYINPTGDAGVVRGSLSGPFYPQTGLFVMDGGLYPEEPVVTGIGITPENLYASTAQTMDYSGMNLAATLGTGGSIWTDNQSLETLFIVKEGQGQPWGIYRQGFAGRFNPDRSVDAIWSGQTGGIGTFGYYYDSTYGNMGNTGYWLANASGNWWGDGSVDGALNNGWFITGTKSGNLSGNFLGVYEGQGNTWQATGLGAWSGAPLAYSAKVLSGSWGYYNTTPGSEGLVNDGYPIAGLTGGFAPLFGELNADVMGLGTYTRNQNSPLFNMLLTNADGGPETNPFHVYYGGSWFPAGIDYPEWFEGKMMGFYGRNWDGTKYNEIGLITSGPLIDEYGEDSGFSVWGDLYAGINMWNIPADEDQGTLTHTTKPGTASSLSVVESYEWSPGAKVDGDLQGTMRTKSAHIDGIEDWGVWMSAMGGSYPDTLPERWASYTGWKETNESGKPSYSIASVDGYAYNDGALWGGVFGRFLNPDNMGVFTGDIVGITNNGNWQALGIGSFEVTKALAFSSVFSGQTFKTAKGTLNTNFYAMPGVNSNMGIFQGVDYETAYFRAEGDTSGSLVKYGWQWENVRNHYDNQRTDLIYYPNDSLQNFRIVNGVPMEGQGSTSASSASWGFWPDLHQSPPASPIVANSNFIIVNDAFPFTGQLAVNPANMEFAKIFSQQVDNWYTTVRLIPDPEVPLAPTFEGIMGGYAKDGDAGRTLWTSTEDNPMGLALMGEHAEFEGPATMAAGIGSSYNGTSTTPDGGAYFGFLTNRVSANRSTRGVFYGFYISPESEAGFLKSTNIAGMSFAGLNMWEADGDIYSEMLGTISMPASDLMTNIQLGAMSGNIQYGGAGGNFVSGGYLKHWAMGNGYTASIKDHSSNGIFINASSAGEYSNPEGSTNWQADFAGYGTFGNFGDAGQPGAFSDYGIWHMNAGGADASWAANEIYAPVSGEFLTYTKKGNLSGTFLGNYSGTTSGIWGGTASGVYQKTANVAFSSGMAGKVYANNLTKWISGTNNGTQYWINGDPANFPNERLYVQKTSCMEGACTAVQYADYGYVDEANPVAYTKTTWQYNATEGSITGQTLAESASMSYENYLAEVNAMRAGAQEYTGWSLNNKNFQGVFAGFNSDSNNLWYNMANGQPTSIELAGLYSDAKGSQAPGIMTTGLASFNPFNAMDPLVNSESPIGGAYYAYMGAAFGKHQVASDLFDGLISGLYLNPDGKAGILYGSIGGYNQPDTGYFHGSGAINGGCQLGEGFNGLSAQNFAYNVIQSSQQWNYGTNDVTVIGDNVKLTTINRNNAWINQNYLSDNGFWGVVQTVRGGTKDSGLAPTAWAWAAHQMNASTPRSDYTGIEITKTENGISTGNYVGAAAIYSGGPVSDPSFTAVSAGSIKGLFDPTATTWQAVSQGSFMETKNFLAKAAAMSGDAAAQEAFMNATKIPAIQVGQATLSQAPNTVVNNLSNVTMNNVAFFAYSTGAVPKIWATNDVRGNYEVIGGYSVAPSTSGAAINNVPLSGNGLTATFNVNHWNGSTWGANVAGSGNLSGGSYAGPVQFQGGAAGTIQSGSFSGTGAGIAK